MSLAKVSHITLFVNPLCAPSENRFVSAADAKAYIRAHIPQWTDVSGVTVYLSHGIHYLERPLVFDEGDCFHDGRIITYSSLPGGTAILDGGRVLNSPDLLPDGVLRYDVPGLEFRQVYTDGRKAARVRYPKGGAWLQLKRWNREKRLIELFARDIPDAESLAGTELVIARAYVQYRVRIRKAFLSGDTVLAEPMLPERDMVFSDRVPNPVPGPGSYYIEGYRGVPMEPGEWDRQGDSLFLMGEIPHNVTVPVCTTLLKLDRTESLRFSGLCLCHTGWNEPSMMGNVQRQGGSRVLPDGRIAVLPGAVEISRSSGIVFERNLIADTGANAMCFGPGTCRNLVLGNKFSRIGDTGIVYDWDNNPEDMGEDVSRFDTIESNYFCRMGQEFHGSAGIWAFWPSHLYVLHNEIAESGNLGMDIGFGGTYDTTCFEANLVTGNKIHHCSHLCNDCGGIHTKSNASGTVISRNWIYDLGHHPEGWSTGSISPVNGIYLDDNSRNYTVYENVVEDIAGLLYTIKGKDNRVETQCLAPELVRAQAGLYPCYRDLLTADSAGVLERESVGERRLAVETDGAAVYVGTPSDLRIFLEDGDFHRRMLRADLDKFTVFSADEQILTCTGTALCGVRPGKTWIACRYEDLEARIPVEVAENTPVSLEAKLEHCIVREDVCLVQTETACDVICHIRYASGITRKMPCCIRCPDAECLGSTFLAHKPGLYELQVITKAAGQEFTGTLRVWAASQPSELHQTVNYPIPDNPSVSVCGNALTLEDGRMAVFSNGEDFWGRQDSATMVVCPVSNGKIRVEMTVDELLSPNGRDVVGILIKENQDARAKNVCLRIRSADKRVILSRRTEYGGKTSLVVTPEKICTLPVTLILQYHKGVCRASYRSGDGPEITAAQCEIPFAGETLCAGVMKASFIEDYVSGAICTQCNILCTP